MPSEKLSNSFERLVCDSVDNLVELPTGHKEFGDLIEFYKVVDFFADRYGMGGCKSIEEFAKMVDELDPVLRTGLYNAGVDAENKKWGGDDVKDKSSSVEADIDIPSYNTAKHKFKPTTSSKKPKTAPVPVNGSLGMRNMLLEFGADSDEVKKACEKISHRKISLKDYSFVDKDYLKDISEQEFKSLLDDMREERKKSINFDVSDDTLRKKIREQKR